MSSNLTCQVIGKRKRWVGPKMTIREKYSLTCLQVSSSLPKLFSGRIIVIGGLTPERGTRPNRPEMGDAGRES